MKKSEALKKIQYEMLCSEKMAEDILQTVLKIGMAPPLVSDEDQQCIMNVYYDGYTLRKWDEDLELDEKVQEMKRRRATRRAT